MRCLRAGEAESPLVPWRDSLAVARTLALWQAAVGDATPARRNHDERLTGVIQPYAWGSRTAIPELLGVAPTGEPQAELWFGAHPLAPSIVDGEPLDRADRRRIRRAWSGRAGRGVRPAAALSGQDHRRRHSRCPCRPIRPATQAEAGYAREQAAGVPRDAPHRTYRDGWPKPELLCALVETEALCGFREPGETYQLFEQLGVGERSGTCRSVGAMPTCRPRSDCGWCSRGCCASDQR